jgi:hypothetical protein
MGPLMGEGWVGVVTPQYNRRNEEEEAPSLYTNCEILILVSGLATA